MNDQYFIKLALHYARKGIGLTFPNRLVGAILVKDGIIVGKACHLGSGLEHAEVKAIRQAGEHAKNATLYTNLEPCCHYGKTPPCTDLIIRSKIKKLVFSTIDPDPRVNGKGASILKNHGIEVDIGICAKEAFELNLAYLYHKLTGSIFTTIKIASSLNGYISSDYYKLLTGKKSQIKTHELRSRLQAICVGINTFNIDQPILDRRFYGKNLNPGVRIVMDSKLQFQDYSWIKDKEKIFIFCSQNADSEKRKKLEQLGVNIISSPINNDGIDLLFFQKFLSTQNINSVLIEGGGKLITSFIRQNLFARLIIFYSPLITSTKNTAWFQAEEIDKNIFNKNLLKLSKTEQLENDLMCVYDTNKITTAYKKLII